jgi:hypothetical protein
MQMNLQCRLRKIKRPVYYNEELQGCRALEEWGGTPAKIS